MFNHYHQHPNIIEKTYNEYMYLHHLNKTSIMEAPHTQILNLGLDKSSTNIILHDCASLIRDIMYPSLILNLLYNYIECYTITLHNILIQFCILQHDQIL